MRLLGSSRYQSTALQYRMPVHVTGLQMITPFDRSIADLSRDQQLLLLRGCALCRVTRQLDQDSRAPKPEWNECVAELGVPIQVLTQDKASAAALQAIGEDGPPAVFAVAPGQFRLVMNRESIRRCSGRVSDFRGRLMFRLAQLGLSLPSQPELSHRSAASTAR